MHVRAHTCAPTPNKVSNGCCEEEEEIYVRVCVRALFRNTGKKGVLA